MNTISELYEAVYSLLEEQSKSDPETEPYRSKYAASELLSGLKSILTSQLDKLDSSQQNDEYNTVKSQLSGVLIQLGIIAVETEELSTGQDHLEKAVELISINKDSPLCICLLVLCHNQLAIIWSQWDEQKKAEGHLITARDVYTNYRHMDLAQPPKALHELFGCKFESVVEGWEALEKLHTLTLYYLAQVMGQLGNVCESAHLCLATLHRQLTSGDYQLASWVINAATLAKYYHNNNKYRVARRLLAAAWTMLLSVQDESSQCIENIKEVRADVSRRFGLYCLTLLNESKDSDTHSQDVEEEEEGEDGHAPEQDSTSEEDCLEKMEFIKLELTPTEESVACRKATCYEEARDLFMAGLRWYNEAQKYTTLDDHATSYTEIIQEISTLYKLLACYEESPDRQSKMHKRRVDLLSNVLNELNPRYYLMVCRQLDYELGETYSAMVDCKYLILEKRAAKINSLVSKSIQHFQNYLNSFKEQRDGAKLPDEFPKDSLRPVLVAYFHLGRLWSKKIPLDVTDKLDNMRQSKDHYEFLVSYCDKYPDSASTVEEELPLCREMIQLLPLKMEQIRTMS